MPQFTPIDIACWMTAIALSGWLIIPRLTVSIQSTLKRERFRYYINGLRGKIAFTQPNDFVHDYTLELREITKFEAEALDVGPFIPKRKIKRFNAACIAYKTTRFGDFGDNDKNIQAQGELIRLLNEISRCAR